MKKVLVKDYDQNVEKLRQESIKIRQETEELLAKMRTEIEQKEAESNG